VQKSSGGWTLAALSGVPLIMVLGNSMLIPILPKMKAALDLSQFQASLVITLFSIPAGLTIPIAGFLADRLGRKKVIIPALITYGIGGIIAGLAALFLSKQAYSLLLAGRVIQGIGAAGTAPIAMALAGDLFTGKSRSKALGLIEASNGMGKVISPILGSLVGLIVWYATFFVFPALVIPVVLGMLFLVRESAGQANKQSVSQYLVSLKSIFQQKGKLLLTSFWTGSVTLFILFGILFYLSDFLETRYRADGVFKGLLLAIPVLAMAVTSFLTGLFIKKQTKLMKALVVTGLVLVAGGLTALPFFDANIYGYFGAIILMGIGSGVVLPCLNTTITSAVSLKERGTVTALYGGVRFVGVALGPPIFGLLLDYSKMITFLGNAGLAAGTSLLALLLLSPREMKTQAQTGQDNQPQKRPWWIIFLETVTLKNTIGRLVLRKPEVKDKQPQEVKQKKNKDNS